jgi:tRNA (guanine6-N2)-methyltransferase
MQKLEIETHQGLEDLCLQDIQSCLDTNDYYDLVAHDNGTLTLTYLGALQRLENLTLAIAAYVLLDYDIPRPKALLGQQNFDRLINTLESILALSSFSSFHLNAAGSNSSVMKRIKANISQRIALPHDDDQADLLIRIRKHRGQWQVLIRTTARPLMTRQWRVEDMPGALSGPVARAMNRLVPIHPHTTYINLMSGSGTLMAEIDQHPARKIGIDNDAFAIRKATTNLDANGHFILADATCTPLVSQVADVITSDLPFGQLVGSHEHNKHLYPAVLREIYRLLRPGAYAVLITHEVRLLDRILADQSLWWHLQEKRMIELRGLHPRVYVLQKTELS